MFVLGRYFIRGEILDLYIRGMSEISCVANTLLLYSTLTYGFLGKVLPYLRIVGSKWVWGYSSSLKIWLLKAPMWCDVEVMIVHVYRMNISRSQIYFGEIPLSF